MRKGNAWRINCLVKNATGARNARPFWVNFFFAIIFFLE
jgi:hypothetical protein